MVNQSVKNIFDNYLKNEKLTYIVMINSLNKKITDLEFFIKSFIENTSKKIKNINFELSTKIPKEYYEKIIMKDIKEIKSKLEKVDLKKFEQKIIQKNEKLIKSNLNQVFKSIKSTNKNLDKINRDYNIFKRKNKIQTNEFLSQKRLSSLSSINKSIIKKRNDSILNSSKFLNESKLPEISILFNDINRGGKKLNSSPKSKILNKKKPFHIETKSTEKKELLSLLKSLKNIKTKNLFISKYSISQIDEATERMNFDEN